MYCAQSAGKTSRVSTPPSCSGFSEPCPASLLLSLRLVMRNHVLLTNHIVVILTYINELEGWLDELGLDERAKVVADWKASYTRPSPE